MWNYDMDFAELAAIIFPLADKSKEFVPLSLLQDNLLSIQHVVMLNDYNIVHWKANNAHTIAQIPESGRATAYVLQVRLRPHEFWKRGENAPHMFTIMLCMISDNCMFASSEPMSSMVMSQ